MATNQLALAVIHDSRTYDERVSKFRSMKRSQYRGFVQAVVAKHAHRERVQFQVRHSPKTIELATDEVPAYMANHVADLDRVAAEEATLTPATPAPFPTVANRMLADPDNRASVIFTMPRTRR